MPSEPQPKRLFNTVPRYFREEQSFQGFSSSSGVHAALFIRNDFHFEEVWRPVDAATLPLTAHLEMVECEKCVVQTARHSVVVHQAPGGWRMHPLHRPRGVFSADSDGAETLVSLGLIHAQAVSFAAGGLCRFTVKPSRASSSELALLGTVKLGAAEVLLIWLQFWPKVLQSRRNCTAGINKPSECLICE